MKSLNMHFRLIPFVFLAALLVSCQCDDTPVISYFAFEELSPKVIGDIDQNDYTISLEVPESTDVSSLTPTIELAASECLQLIPASGLSQDFTNPVIYEVFNEAEHTVQYEVTVTRRSPVPDTLHIAWKSAGDMPVALGWTASSLLEDKFYISGGANADDGILNLIQVFDPATGSWTVADERMKSNRWGHTSNELNGKIYVMGGTNVAQGVALKSIEVFDPSAGSWEVEGEMTAGRIGHGAVVHQGKIYIMGGEYEEPSLTTLRSLEVFDPSSGHWEMLSPMPTARIFMASCVVGDTIYAIGGGSKYPYAGVRNIEAYIIPEDRWEKKADLKIGLGDLRACVIDGKIFCAGGWALWGDVGNSTVQVYDPKQNVVQMADELMVARGAAATLSYQGKIYVMGGMESLHPFITIHETEIGIPDL
jgi:N-acetylneuraminic acid mutarotase